MAVNNEIDFGDSYLSCYRKLRNKILRTVNYTFNYFVEKLEKSIRMIDCY